MVAQGAQGAGQAAGVGGRPAETRTRLGAKPSAGFADAGERAVAGDALLGQPQRRLLNLGSEELHVPAELQGEGLQLGAAP